LETEKSGQRRILVVDDEAVIVDAARKILSAEGFCVQTAGNAEEAFPQLQTFSPHIALVDLMLPGLPGNELLQLVKREYPRMAVIMMTGYSTLDNAITFLKNGALDFLPKPFEFIELVSTIRRASRFLDMSRTTNVAEAQDSESEYYCLGIGSWANPDRDGTVRLGISDVFRQAVGPVIQVELPALHGELYQGGLLAQAYAQDELKHTVWSALGGRVVAVNPLAKEIFQPGAAGHWETGWLVRVIPGKLESELLNLRSLRPEADAERS
jgi:FixJ family two-component response regulator/glycine cleavage system H lipoate-binding protein